jgi:hypothetical protein
MSLRRPDDVSQHAVRSVALGLPPNAAIILRCTKPENLPTEPRVAQKAGLKSPMPSGINERHISKNKAARRTSRRCTGGFAPNGRNMLVRFRRQASTQPENTTTLAVQPVAVTATTK